MDLQYLKKRFEGKTVKLFDVNATMWANVRGGIKDSQNLLLHYGKKNNSPYRIKDFKTFVDGIKRHANVINKDCSISYGKSNVDLCDCYVIWFDFVKLTDEPEETEILVKTVNQVW